MTTSEFPPDFLWGVATSSYQIEGAINEGGRGASIWDQFAATPGKTFRGHTGAVAADHYHRMADDVALMASLGVRSYRFSVAWPRVIPDGRGPVNTQGLDFYDRLVDMLVAHDIVPLVTLYHWDLPTALHTRGGWLHRETAEAFADYSVVVAKRLGDRVHKWITHNEPWCAAYQGYGNGKHAPGIVDNAAAVSAGHHLLVSHGLALQRMRSVLGAKAQIGIALNIYPVYPEDDKPATLEATAHADDFKNRWFLDPVLRGTYPEHLFSYLHTAPPPVQPGDMDLISQPIDFLGVNYYTRSIIHATPHGYTEVNSVQGASYTAMGWEVYPQGLTVLMRRLHEEYAAPPIMITENGSAFYDKWDEHVSMVDDPERLHYLQSHIAALEAAAKMGVRVGGYFAWSLLDNFEWSEGYDKRFGLVYVDYITQRRIPKASAHWYGQYIRSQRIDEPEIVLPGITS